MFVAIGVCLGAAIWFGLLARGTQASQESKQSRLSKLPEIKSCLEHIKVVKAELINQGNSQVAAVELENQAFVGVISISIETIVNREKRSVVKSGFTPDKPPMIVIPPGERKTITLGNLGANSAIRIGAVMFADGTEEGCASSLKTVRELKDHDTKKVRP